MCIRDSVRLASAIYHDLVVVEETRDRLTVAEHQAEHSLVLAIGAPGVERVDLLGAARVVSVVGLGALPGADVPPEL
eukprot:7031719-Alexandrium_andersonii.AAC.1